MKKNITCLMAYFSDARDSAMDIMLKTDDRLKILTSEMNSV